MLSKFSKRITMLVFIVIMMLATFVAEAAELKIVYPESGLYSLQPMCAPKKELTVHNASTANGANVIIWEINSNWHTQKSHQKWYVQRIGNTEWYKILAENSGLALNIHNGIAANGTNVSIWPFGGNMHKFRFLDAGNGYYVIQGHVNGAYVLDVSGASNINGANVQIYEFNGTGAQKWKLVKRTAYILKGDVDGNGKVELADLNLLQKHLSNSRITINKNNSDLNGDGRITIIDLSQLKSKLNQNSDKVVIIANGWYKIASANYLSRGLDVNSSGTTDGSNVILYNYAGTNNQKFYLENKGSGWFTLKVGHCDKYVSAANASGTNYTNVQINSKNNSNTQLWRLIDAGNGYYYIESKLRKGLSFDCANGGSANSTNIQLWNRGNVLWNKWKFTKVSAPDVVVDTGFNWPIPGCYQITTRHYYSSGTKHSCRYYSGGRNKSSTTPYGIDIYAPNGTKIYAPADGMVRSKEDKGKESFGKYFEILHNDGTVSLFAHLSNHDYVYNGKKVKKGDFIALSGNTGNVKGKNGGYHLHYELSIQDPYVYHKNKGDLK